MNLKSKPLQTVIEEAVEMGGVGVEAHALRVLQSGSAINNARYSQQVPNADVLLHSQAVIQGTNLEASFYMIRGREGGDHVERHEDHITGLSISPTRTEDQRQELIDIIAYIREHPSRWDQSTWHSGCGTSHCVAGWAQVRAGMVERSTTCFEDARKLLGLTEEGADILFHDRNSLADLEYLSEIMT